MAKDPVALLKQSVEYGKPTEFTVTGVMMQYYHVCHRKLWFFDHGIEADEQTQEIRRGVRVNSNSYSQSKKAKHYGPISPDIMQDGKLVEVKPSSAMEKATEMQLGYYLWYLESICDISKDGVVVYPKERERRELELTTSLAQEIEEAIRGIYDVVTAEEPPEFEEKEVCGTCAYKYLCWSGLNE